MDALERLENEASVWQMYLRPESDLNRDVLAVCRELRAARAAVLVPGHLGSDDRTYSGWEDCRDFIAEKMEEARSEDRSGETWKQKDAGLPIERS